MLFIVAERCDLQFATKEISRGMSAPTVGDMSRLKRACRYLAGTRDLASFLVPEFHESLLLKAMVDSDWAGDRIGRKSTSAAHLFLNGALIHSHSRTQATMAANSAEADVY